MTMVTDFLLSQKKENFIIFDGFPRTLIQADRLDDFTKNSDVSIYNVLRLKCPEDVLISRLSGRDELVSNVVLYIMIFFHHQKYLVDVDVEDAALAKRLDDEPVVIKKRLKIYNKLTKPLADYYKKKSMLVELNANCSPQDVRDHTLKIYEDII